MLGATLKGPVEIPFEPVQSGQPVAGRGVAQLIDQAREAVDGEQVRTDTSRQSPAGDGEVLALGTRHHRARGGSADGCLDGEHHRCRSGAPTQRLATRSSGPRAAARRPSENLTGGA